MNLASVCAFDSNGMSAGQWPSRQDRLSMPWALRPCNGRCWSRSVGPCRTHEFDFNSNTGVHCRPVKRRGEGFLYVGPVRSMPTSRTIKMQGWLIIFSVVGVVAPQITFSRPSFAKFRVAFSQYSGRDGVGKTKAFLNGMEIVGRDESLQIRAA